MNEMTKALTQNKIKEISVTSRITTTVLLLLIILKVYSIISCEIHWFLETLTLP